MTTPSSSSASSSSSESTQPRPERARAPAAAISCGRVADRRRLGRSGRQHRLHPVAADPAGAEEPERGLTAGHRRTALTKPSGWSRVASSASPSRSSGKRWVIERRRIEPAQAIAATASRMPAHGDRRVALVRIDHVDAAPVPELHVDLPRPVLVIAGDRPAGRRSRVSSAARSSGHCLPTASITRSQNAPPVSSRTRSMMCQWSSIRIVSAAPMRRARSSEAGRREIAITRAPASLASLRQDRAEKADADDRHASAPRAMSLRRKMFIAQPSGSPAERLGPRARRGASRPRPRRRHHIRRKPCR